MIHLNFSKKFDRVAHQRLLTKVKIHGIDGKVLVVGNKVFRKTVRNLMGNSK